ncbi:Pentatricopeptide repeat [Macleaya cordata]|uniref:Pentatricopeptide repeat n=1 Tax=Macleaya cordata TaxID=56857 RepID=A0A200QT46_MACCD|nr:Pentatricopeptide repeat [Macleaya cordata]
MEILGVSPDCLTLPIVLKACARLQAVEKGKKIHSDIQKTPQLAQDVRVRTALIDFYSKCGLLEEARNVFEETLNRDIVSFNAMICGYVGNSRHEEAIELFLLMQQRENLKPSSVTLVGLLSACSELWELRLGQEIHCYCLRNRLFDVDPHLGTALIGFYSRFDMRIASLVFDSMTVKNIVTWNSMISGYFNVGDKSEALRFFSGMLVDGINPGFVTILVAIKSCMDFGYLEFGRQMHQLAIKYGFSSDLFIVSALINMYGKNESLESSCQLFKTISTRDVVLWNSMLSAYKDCGSHDGLFTLFRRMRLEGVREDSTTVAIVLLACSELANNLGTGKGLHAHVIKSGIEMDASLKNALLSMYAQLNCVESAEKKFHEMKYPDILSWNTLILVLARKKVMARLFGLFKRMQQSNFKPNSFTMVAILALCEDKESLSIGRSIHGYVIRDSLEINSSLCTALTTMYINCGDEVTARNLFENYPNRDLISWNALITSYVESNRPDEALSLFHQMITEVEPNSVSIINVLSSCAHLSSLPQSRCIHAYAIRREFALGSNISLGNALITTYARCGSISNSENVFRSLKRRDVISWNAMIAGYGMHGFAEKALLAFSQMQELGLSPNNVTFVSVLSACSHAGLIDKGWHLFRSMTGDYNITPEVVHYACMVDLLGRGGHLDKAKDFIDSMPIEPDASVWRALLGACRVLSETKLAREVFIKLVELEPMNVGNYILLSNIYAAAGLREEVRKLRADLKKKGLTKDPGNSWIVVRSQVHSFTAGDRSHPQSTKIYKKLSCLTASIMETGYFPDQRWVLQDLKDEEKVQNLLSHSEKLAIAFGLLNMSAGVPILITKNLRVCGDCHTFSKHVSKSVGREIILRDTSRFHHFVNGVCSCKDYW